MTVKAPTDITKLSDEALAELATAARAEFDAIRAKDIRLQADADRGEALAAIITSCSTETAARVTAAAEVEARFNAAAASLEAPAEGTVEAAAETVEAGAETVEAGAEVLAPIAPNVTVHSGTDLAAFAQFAADMRSDFLAAIKEMVPAPTELVAGAGEPVGNALVAAASRTSFPVAPSRTYNDGLATIIAAADIPGFGTGTVIDMSQLAEASTERFAGIKASFRGNYRPEDGASIELAQDGEMRDMRKLGIASIKKPYAEDQILIGKAPQLIDDLIMKASDERLLEGGSLVAAGGWCAPSETLYGLCETETIDGILSIPELQAPRGGVNITLGPDFASIYSAVGFQQTEAQAISGTTKPAVQVSCPSFTETRLDVIGLNIVAPLLTEAAYPELVARFMRGALVAFAHKVNFYVLAKIEALLIASGNPITGTDLHSTVNNLFDYIEFLVWNERTKWRLALNATMIVVLPAWLKGALRSDFAARNAIEQPWMVSDQMIEAALALRGAQVEWVYDWRDLPTVGTEVAYPTTFKIMLYPAGAFVRLNNDVINVSAVYDQASLSTNMYTELFMEEGIAVARTCFGGRIATLNTANFGLTGGQLVNALTQAQV